MHIEQYKMKSWKGGSNGNTTTIKGSLNRIPYHLFAIKDKDYAIKLITTYSSLNIKDCQGDLVYYIKIERNKRQRITFKYTKNFSNYYKRRHAVSNHNHLCY